jgi:alpha-ketoglutarate-dependent taurine dioxygenase
MTVQPTPVAPRFDRVHVEPLTPVIGAEVDGVDLATVDDETWAEIETAFAKHQVLFFRDQDLGPEPLLALGRRLGPVHVHPAAPSLDGYPEVMLIHADERSKVVAGNGWHTDVSCDEQPPMATLLWMQTVPDAGGDTLFASTTAAWDALSGPVRAFLTPLRAVHDGAHVYAGRYGQDEKSSRDGKFPRAEHPVARTHPVTGRTSLYVNRGFTTRIRGLKPAESAALLGFLFDHVEDPHFQCRFRWRAGSLAMWDNRCVQHLAVWDYFPQTRHGLRVSVVGERPH